MKIKKEIVTSDDGRKLTLINVDNGILAFNLILERSLDIGDIYYKGEKVSWNRSRSYLKHPDSIDLKKDGFEPGFYAAVTSLGPEVFGTPDEIRTPHGTGAYSEGDINTLSINNTDTEVSISVNVPIRGYFCYPQYSKRVTVVTRKDSVYLERTEVFSNLTKDTLPLDDAYHIQLCGDFLKEGGRYVLPVNTEDMLLRDSVPFENSKKEIIPFKEKLDPIRCYQYVPKSVKGLDKITILSDSEMVKGIYGDVICEMLVNKAEDKGAIIIRPKTSFDRTLLAKRNITDPMYAIEPCKTRPNSIKQKAIDGELRYILPNEEIETHILIGFSDSKEAIDEISKCIEREVFA